MVYRNKMKCEGLTFNLETFETANENCEEKPVVKVWNPRSGVKALLCERHERNIEWAANKARVTLRAVSL